MTRRRGAPGFAGVRGYGTAGSLGDASRKQPRPKPKRERDRTVDVPCWCERKMLRVSLDDIMRGKTGTCGARSCYDPHPND